MYIAAQLLGGVCGAGIIYGNYVRAIDAVEGGRSIRTVPGTASLFGTYAVRQPLGLFCVFLTWIRQPDYLSAGSCFFEQVNLPFPLFLLIPQCISIPSVLGHYYSRARNLRGDG